MKVDIELSIKSVYFKEPPLIKITVGDDVLHDGYIHKDTVFNYNEDINAGKCKLSIELFNKHDSDAEHPVDKAVIVDSISFFKINSKNLIHLSEYYPIYSETYIASMQANNHVLHDKLLSCNYLGWNGTWVVAFEVPVFSFLHAIESLGWTYPSH